MAIRGIMRAGLTLCATHFGGSSQEEIIVPGGSCEIGREEWIAYMSQACRRTELGKIEPGPTMRCLCLTDKQTYDEMILHDHSLGDRMIPAITA